MVPESTYSNSQHTRTGHYAAAVQKISTPELEPGKNQQTRSKIYTTFTHNKAKNGSRTVPIKAGIF
jgi:hypothetical protein